MIRQALAALILSGLAGLALAQENTAPQEPPAAPAENAVRAATVQRGPVTNLPIPRYVSLKASEANVRRGPSLSHRIDWVFKRRDLPLEIVAEYGNWRKVRDRDGVGGWVHYSLLSGTRTVLIEAETVALRSAPDPAAPIVAKLERGVVARLGDCSAEWCRLRVEGHRGWAPKARLWGVNRNEIRE